MQICEATSHIVNKTGTIISHLHPYIGNDKLFVENGEALEISHMGQG